MAPLLRTSFLFFLLFGLLFALIHATGLIEVESFRLWLLDASSVSPWHVAALVVVLLVFDLFFAVPTLTITILAGGLLGYPIGALSAFLGLFLAGIMGYGLGLRYGEKVLSFMIRDEGEFLQMKEAFQKSAFVMILLSRALPFLPEFTACLSGVTRLSFPLFLMAWLMSITPYVLINSYMGSISSLENPQPALFGALGTTLLLGLGWALFKRSRGYFSSNCPGV